MYIRAPTGFPADNDEVSDHLIQAICHVGRAKWDLIGLDLSLSDSDLQQISQNTAHNIIQLKQVIDLWKSKATKSTDATVKKLLAACKLSDVGRLAIKKKYTELLQQFEN